MSESYGCARPKSYGFVHSGDSVPLQEVQATGGHREQHNTCARSGAQPQCGLALPGQQSQRYTNQLDAAFPVALLLGLCSWAPLCASRQLWLAVIAIRKPR